MAGGVPVLTASPHQETPSPTRGTESLEQTGTTVEHQLQVYKQQQCTEVPSTLSPVTFASFPHHHPCPTSSVEFGCNLPQGEGWECDLAHFVQQNHKHVAFLTVPQHTLDCARLGTFVF